MIKSSTIPPDRSSWFSRSLKKKKRCVERSSGGADPSGDEKALSHDKDLVPRAVIIRTNGAHPRCATWIPKAIPRAFLSETGGSGPRRREDGEANFIGEITGRSPTRSASLRQRQRQYAPRGDDVYKLFSRASFMRPHVTTIERIVRLNSIKFEFALRIYLIEKMI